MSNSAQAAVRNNKRHWHNIILYGALLRFIYCCAECRYAECHYAECHYAEYHYADCWGAIQDDHLSCFFDPTSFGQKTFGRQAFHQAWVRLVNEGN